MPAVAAGALVAGLAAGTTFAAGVLTVGFSLTAFAGSLVLGAISYALTPKPKAPAFSQDVRGSNVSVRQSDLTRQFVYGHARVTRGYAHIQSTGLNGTMHMILILCEGELRSINEIWVNDYVIPPDWIDSNGNITQGRYAGYMTIRKHLGGQFQAADSSAVANMTAWTNDHRLQGTAYLYITMTKNQDVYPTGVPNFTAVVEGPAPYDPRTEENTWSTNISLYARDFITNSRYGFSAANEDIDDVNISAQANICDEIVDTESVLSEVSSISTSTNIITLDGDLLQYQFGDRVIISSTGDIPGGLSDEEEYYVIPYQIKTTPRILLAETLDDAMAKNAIDITSAGSGDITITKTGEPRYHGGGVFDSDSEPSRTLNDLSSCMAGRAVCIGGFWSLLAGAWRSPSLTLGLGDVRGQSISFKNALSISDSFNEVKGLFISSLTYYQPSDYPSAVYQQFIDDDNGVLSAKEINLPFCNRPTTAQRIAKIELFRGRQGIAIESYFSTKALQIQPGDTVNLSIPEYGWEPKIFEVTTFAFDVSDGNMVVKLNLRETAQAIYDWTQGEAIDFDPAPDTALPSPFNVVAPTGVGYNSRIVETQEADQLFIMQLQWDLHPDAFVQQFGDFELQFKKSVDLNWFPSFFVDGMITQSDLFSSSVGVPYDIRIRARNNLGVRSSWVTILGAVVGSSGGVGATFDWETFSDPVGSGLVEDWQTFSDPVGSGLTQDWGYFT
jgi:hypothetical protein